MYRYIVALLLLLSLVPIEVEADRVYLRSGQDFEVERWWEQGDTFLYQRLGGIVAIPRRDVERVERSEKPAPRPEAAPGPCDPFEPLVTKGGRVPPCSPQPDPCGPRFPGIGHPETAIYAWAACRGYTTTEGRVLSPDLFTVTVTATEKQFVVGAGRSRAYISTRNGTITAIQRRE